MFLNAAACERATSDNCQGCRRPREVKSVSTNSVIAGSRRAHSHGQLIQCLQLGMRFSCYQPVARRLQPCRQDCRDLHATFVTRQQSPELGKQLCKQSEAYCLWSHARSFYITRGRGTILPLRTAMQQRITSPKLSLQRALSNQQDILASTLLTLSRRTS